MRKDYSANRIVVVTFWFFVAVTQSAHVFGTQMAGLSFVISKATCIHRNLELCKTLKTTTEQFSLFSTEQFGGRRIKSGTRGKPPRRVRVTATRAWAQLAGVRASKMLPYIISLMPLVRSQPVSRAAASLGPKGPAVLRRRCRQYRRAPRNSWQHVS